MKADHWICGIGSCVWKCRQPQGKPGRMSVGTALTNESSSLDTRHSIPLLEMSSSTGEPGIMSVPTALTNESSALDMRHSIRVCRQPQGKPGRNAHLWQWALTNDTQDWIRGIRSRVWRCRQPQGKPGIETSIFYRGRSQMKPSTGYGAFDPASGDVISRRGNQVKICPSFTGGSHK
jgi:hypothetical protein